jgi:hypothetical protein
MYRINAVLKSLVMVISCKHPDDSKGEQGGLRNKVKTFLCLIFRFKLHTMKIYLFV